MLTGLTFMSRRGTQLPYLCFCPRVQMIHDPMHVYVPTLVCCVSPGDPPNLSPTQPLTIKLTSRYDGHLMLDSKFLTAEQLRQGLHGEEARSDWPSDADKSAREIKG